MFAATFSQFWGAVATAEAQTAPPRRKPAPLFIGDAVQPFGGETLLLTLLREEAMRDKDDQSDA